MKLSLILLLLILIGHISKSIAFQRPPQNKTEKIVLEKVRALSEVQAFLKRSKEASVLIEDEPSKDSSYYSVKMGYDKEDIFLTLWRFYVDQKNFQVYFSDFLDDMHPITIACWRRWSNDPGFDKDHTYKAGKLVVLRN